LFDFDLLTSYGLGLKFDRKLLYNQLQKDVATCISGAF